MIIIVNSILPVYLFQVNKSYGSKKPFAFILWCTTSRVRHSRYYQDNAWIAVNVDCTYTVAKTPGVSEMQQTKRYLQLNFPK